MEIDHNFYMNLALQEAWKYQVLTYPNPAVGCCVVGKHGEILAVEAHHKAGEPHAEVNALQKAYYQLTNNSEILELFTSHDIHTFLIKNHNNLFNECSVYTTLEPCSHVGKTPSCANLLSSLGVKKVYVGANDFNEEAAQGNEILQNNNIEVETQVLEKECSDLLLPFKNYIKGRFVFFKWAQRLNGTFDQGSISSAESKKQVHLMRDKCDLLIIGGNTVRIDRPTLDARLVNGKAPDVLIISREKEFDKNIPLFGIENRKVFIADNFDVMKHYKNIMIEGGDILYELTKDFVDLYLCYLAPKIGGERAFKNIDDELEILNADKAGEDIIMWMKKAQK
ncbi:bifunctional diaminohydroxyphosphoribosylaminopyrimidine deaminase/5-amino-6-(5-phosphoribosylamino)uracil reductase RibD [Sulfurimonas marina]|uniref:Riboflavin biosynthesis protein RibD n=1 Tax=Sulfurimonas marina TaxID=2590551 RepID=A0A7M1AW30_9BACT|nr:bifunctional diaminohydroxyphosphoribosylaminopyrimidine deaminase/5-amino-6-(5-phosphoribosylamino)uracil reductase RibD [Sulfurimonas marina]QOP41653.1 bifunctional diaminohydroxyphosphoribosylaminopyrimidine deaminase/5-amino-6-(5-phosphoribosylamino)uracil reductase RibD [Sulfurimonas marina]